VNRRVSFRPEAEAEALETRDCGIMRQPPKIAASNLRSTAYRHHFLLADEFTVQFRSNLAISCVAGLRVSVT